MHKLAENSCIAQSTSQPTVELIRVLHVDDDSSYRALCTRYLSKDPTVNYHITGIGCASGAIEACLVDQYDCLILDYALPDSTGTELLTSLHEIIGDALPPAVILTAAGGETAATQAIRVNAADFISKKNVNPRSLRRTVYNLVEKYRLQNDVRVRTDELGEAYESLRRKNDEIKNFYHTVSHEVKTPLSAIREFISLVNDEVSGPVNQSQKELLGYAMDSCDQISNHFNDLIELTRLETKKHSLQFEHIELGRLITRSLTGLRGIAQEQRIKLMHRDSSDSSDSPMMFLDTNRIVQVISNLLSNAIKYSEPNSYVYIESEVNTNSVAIRVIDSGCGIDECHLHRVFDRLYQINPDEDNPFSGGLGLGLSIAQEIADSHGGSLSVDSQLGKGSTFTLTLPISAR